MGKKKHNRCRPNKYLNEEDRKNDLMKEYYKGIFQWNDEQWDMFYNTMRTELPATFRVTGFRQQSREVLWLIKNKFLEQLIDKESNNGDSITKTGPLAKSLPWYPGDMAWQLNASKMEIRKTPELKKLHQFLISETDCGFISRQEAVSMLPPLLLDIEPHHKVLDLCAAPGSKTAQLLEMLHSGTDSMPTGVVVANDIDSKRCYMMVHQLQRLQSPCVVVVRQDASIFPRMFLPDPRSKSGKSPMLFDRILADVPCSGDGTLRKNQDLWPRWSPFLGMNEHFLQMKILRRSLEMLAEGGRMVYSTCSLNPVEDEAVIASVLSQCKGTVKLIDITDRRLPGLISEPGLTSWNVMLKDKTWCKSMEDVPIELRRSFRATLFPPEDVETLNMQFCRRVLPQQQNTGGFFIALLEKVSNLPWMRAVGKENDIESGGLASSSTEEEEKKPVEIVSSDCPSTTTNVESVPTVANNNNSTGPAKKKARIFKEDPFIYLSPSDTSGAWSALQQFYDISSAFPHRQLMYRNADGKRRNYYFTNQLLQQLVETNTDNINFVNLGVKIFGISEDKLFTGYRVLQEGIEIIEPFIGSQQRRLTLPTYADLVTLLTFDMPLITEFSADMQQLFHALSVGPVVFQYDPPCSTDSNNEMPRIPLRFTGWRGRSSLRHYVGVHERSHLLRLCGVEPVEVLTATRKTTDFNKLYPNDDQSDIELQQIEEGNNLDE